MSYDAWEESTKLIEHGLPGMPDRLSRRRRFGTDVPPHGTIWLVWGSRRAPAVALLGTEGEELERIDLRTVDRPPRFPLPGT